MTERESRVLFSSFFVDRKFKVPRKWSNRELQKVAHLFTGKVVNVSAWRDEDKEGEHYREYFKNCSSYTITNYVQEAMGFQGLPGEIFLDLTKDLPSHLQGQFDVVFNHTALEHIFEVHTAFRNLCAMSRDIAIIVVPFLQPMHADFGDYWRFTPSCIQKLFENEGFKVLYSSFNNHVAASVYLFCIAARDPEKWRETIPSNLDANRNVVITSRPIIEDGFAPMVGANAIPNVGYAFPRICLNIKRRLFNRLDPH